MPRYIVMRYYRGLPTAHGILATALLRAVPPNIHFQHLLAAVSRSPATFPYSVPKALRLLIFILFLSASSSISSSTSLFSPAPILPLFPPDHPTVFSRAPEPLAGLPPHKVDKTARV